MTPYAKERCVNPGAHYSSTDQVLEDPNLTSAEKEYILKSMAVDLELLDAEGTLPEAPGEQPADVDAIERALSQLGDEHSFPEDSAGREGDQNYSTEPSPTGFRRIVAAVVGEGDLDRAIIAATGTLSRLSGGAVTFVSVIPPDVGVAQYAAVSPFGGAVVPPPEILPDVKTRLDERRTRVEGVLASLAERPPEFLLDVRDGPVEDEVLSAAKERSADLIVIGAHDHNWFEGLFSSETARRVVSLASCPVLIVPEQVGK